MRRLAAMFAILGLLAIPSFAVAQDSMPSAGAARGGGGGGGTQVKKKTTYDFDGDDVNGNLVKPDGTGIQGEQHGKTSSLIDIRSDFIPEMLKTVEDL